MTITRPEVWTLCKQFGPRKQFDPHFTMAVCDQETERAKKIANAYDLDMARLEEGFYRKYAQPGVGLSTSVEVLLSTSYGIMQMLGWSLYETGYFKWHFAQQVESYRQFFHDPMMNMTVAKAIDDYCVHPEWNLEWGCLHLSNKRAKARGDIKLMLSYWNGDLTGDYAAKVLARIPTLKKEFTL